MEKLRLSIFAFVCANVLSFFANAATYSAEQILSIAVSNSSLIKANELFVKSHEKYEAQAGSWENPVFEIGTEEKKEAGGKTTSTQYRLSQTLLLGGNLSSKEAIARTETEAAKIELSISEIQLRYQVLNLIYSLKAAKEKLLHSEERLERFKTAEQFLRSRVFAAPQKQAEANIVSAKLIVLQKELAHVKAEKERIWYELNSHLKMPSEPEILIEWIKKVPVIESSSVSQNTLENNLELKRQDIEVKAFKAEADLASAETWPAFTIGGSYSDGTGYSPEKIYGLSLSFPIPLFNFNISKRNASLLKSKAGAEKLNFLKDQLAVETQQAILNYQLSKDLVESIPIKKIDQIEKDMVGTDRGFRRGQVDLLTYLEADSQHYESVVTILDSQLELIKSISEIEMLTNKKQSVLEK
jgi:outer membrane protein, heavy metal efflux system